MAKYNAGVCNIDSVERKKRLVVGIVGFVNAFILSAILLIRHEFTLLYPTVFFLYITGFIGYLQYRHQFCTAYALREKFKVTEEEEKVQDSEKVSKDRKKAATIIIESILGAAVLTSLVYLATTKI